MEIPKVHNYDQFSVMVMLVLLVRKGFITEQEMIDFFNEVTEIDRKNTQKNLNKTIEQLLEKGIEK